MNTTIPPINHQPRPEFSVGTHTQIPSAPTAKPRQQPPTSEQAEATVAARFAVSDYLRDLGIRDPDLLASETRRIVEEAIGEFAPGEPIHETLLCEVAIRMTVDRLKELLDQLSLQGRDSHGSEQPEALVAADLPNLLSQFPEVLHQQAAPGGATCKLHRVVPQASPRPMKPQALRLAPRILRRVIDFFSGIR